MIQAVNDTIGFQVKLPCFIHFDTPAPLAVAPASFLSHHIQPKPIQCIDRGDVTGGCRLEGSVLDETVANTLNGKDGLLIACRLEVVFSLFQYLPGMILLSGSLSPRQVIVRPNSSKAA
jgi:hypothetical protein